MVVELHTHIICNLNFFGKTPHLDTIFNLKKCVAYVHEIGLQFQTKRWTLAFTTKNQLI